MESSLHTWPSLATQRSLEIHLKGLKEISHGCNCQSGERVISTGTQISFGIVAVQNIFEQWG